MTEHTSIKKIIISGGTHGNELTGVEAISYWSESGRKLKSLVPSANISFVLANKDAVEARLRYIDDDLNRQFTKEKLAETLTDEAPLELKLAHKLNNNFGPKGNSKTDLIIDIHNTTSNMGPTLIILENDDFHRNLARFVKKYMSNTVVLLEDLEPLSKLPYFCSIAKRGIMIEIGPQAHSTMRAEIFEQAKRMCSLVLEYVEKFNNADIDELAEVEAFRLDSEVPYPLSSNGCASAMIHPNIDNKDFKLLKHGDPVFMDFDGNTLTWHGDDTYPHFIGEAAYNHLKLAFATADKIKL